MIDYIVSEINYAGIRIDEREAVCGQSDGEKWFGKGIGLRRKAIDDWAVITITLSTFRPIIDDQNKS